IVSLTVFFAPGSALLGVIPTPDTLEAFRELDRLGRDSIGSQSVPANATQGIVFLLCIAIAVIATLMDLLAQSVRVPALAGVPLLVLLLAPSFVRIEFSDAFLFALTAVAYLGMLVLGSNPVGRRTALGIGAAAVAGALVLPLALPAVEPGAEASGGNAGISTGLNPILTLGADLRRGDPTLALTYTTTAVGGNYLRLTALDDFSGISWEPSDSELDPANVVDAIGPVPGLGGGVPTTPVTTEISIGSILTRWLPVPYAATSIEGLEGEWNWEPEGLTVRSDRSNARGQVYTVESTLVAPSVEQLVGAGTTVEPGMERYLAVPDDLPEIVGSTALDVVGSAANNYDKAIALQDYFRSGDFTYSEDAPVEEGYDGSGASVLAAFLDAKAGYCVHFSSAMAILARMAGIPARVSLGYLPGDRVIGADTRLSYTVGTDDLHAWPELYFSGVGWVPFEPTPGRGSVPDYARAESTGADGRDTGDTGAPERTQQEQAPVTPSTDATTSANGSSDAPSAGVLAGAALLVLVILGAPAIVRVFRRRRRLGALRSGRARAVTAWQEISDTAQDYGLAVSEADTPRGFAEALTAGAVTSERAGAAIIELLDAVEHERFADPDSERDRLTGTRLAASTEIVIAAIARGAGLGDRVRARCAPASVLSPPRVRIRVRRA
ncbi:MAG: DUF3488 and transglutaminase-like domain-containing protein, partial [Mycetocola sp.]